MMRDKRLVDKNSLIGHKSTAYHPEYGEQASQSDAHQKNMDER
jgi:hypothetical protein